MSGTSMEGLDCGLFDISLNSDYELDFSCREFMFFTYSEYIRESIRNALEGDEAVIKDVGKILGEEFTAISEEFIKGRQIGRIASHGQTVAHNDGVSSLQIGDPQSLYEKFQVPVVYDFRQADIDAGGNGAPLMPFLDWLIFKDDNKETITLNLGGVANITFIPKSGKRKEVIGFDTGPGMALIDECCRLLFGELIDKNGIYAKKGTVNEDILLELMAHDFIQKSPPKSTGRDEFGKELVNSIVLNYSKVLPVDLVRTFCEFTAKSIAENLKNYLNINTTDNHFIISGGGVHHPVIMESIKKYTKISNLKTSNVIGINPDMKEALLMAAIGVARIKGMTANMPSVTGADKMVILGDII